MVFDSKDHKTKIVSIFFDDKPGSSLFDVLNNENESIATYCSHNDLLSIIQFSAEMAKPLSRRVFDHLL